jgi:hypothetical protein
VLGLEHTHGALDTQQCHVAKLAWHVIRWAILFVISENLMVFGVAAVDTLWLDQAFTRVVLFGNNARHARWLQEWKDSVHLHITRQTEGIAEER